MGIAVLGPLTIEGDQGQPQVLGRRDRVVLAALAVRPGYVVSSEELAAVVWGEQPPSSWPKVIQGCVVRLRKILGVHSIETLPLGYRLAVPLDEIDAQRFERAMGRARALFAADEAERAAVVLADALTLWRGHPLTELDGWDIARIEVERLGELRHAAEELYVEAALSSGQHDKVLAKARALVNEEPLRERRWILLATAQYQAGQQSEALRTIHRLRGILSRELGLDPNPEIDALEQAILRQDPSLVAEHAMPEPDRVCPYPGLKAYDLDDADTFFGRDADIAACLRKLTDTSVLAVIGPSGCGKSSLVRAGVAASLQRDGRRVVVMTPGVHPVAALAATMPTTGPPLALVVDQCEEVFSLCGDAAERDTFLTALTAHQAMAPLILSFRADRIADISGHPVFARTIEPGLYLLSGMTQTDLRAAIEKPARLASLIVEPGLVDLLVNEVADQPGALPLMSHALGETWRRREGRTLTVAGYNASGGIRGAVAQSAEQVYEHTPPEQRPVLRDLLLRLVTPGPEGELIRSRLPRRLVITGAEDDAMVDRLVGSRLVTSDDGVVGLAHESLARAWPRLRGWLEDDLEGQRTLHHLAVAADSWDSLGRPDSELYRGVRLAKASDWQERRTSTLTPTEGEFLAASKRASQGELRAAEERTRQQVRVNRRLRGALATGALLLVGALIAGFAAVRQTDRAEQAVVSELARQVGARALLTEGISHSILLAAHGVRLEDSPETRANLIAAINKHPSLLRSMPAPLGRTDDLDLSPDGRRIVASDDNSTFHLYDAQSGQVLDSYSFGEVSDGSQTWTLSRFSPDGRFVAAIAGSVRGQLADPQWPARLLRADTLEPVTPQLAVPEPTGTAKWWFNSVAFSGDGRYLATSVSTDNFAQASFGLIWDLHAPDHAPRKITFDSESFGVALSPDGSTIYTNWPLAAFDVATGRQKWQRPNVRGDGNIEVSTAGDLLAVQQLRPTRLDAAPMALIDAQTGKTVRTMPVQFDSTRGFTFSAGDKLLAVAEEDGEVILWDVATGTVRERIETSEVSWAVDFSPDGQTLYTAGDEGIMRAHDLSGQRRHLGLTSAVPARDYLHLLPSADGRTTAYLWRDAKGSWVTFADTATGATTTPTKLGIDLEREPWSPAAWNPDGRKFAVHDSDAITTVDARTGKVLELKENLDVLSISYVDNGARLLIGSTNGIVFYDHDLWPEGQDVWWPADCCLATSADGQSAVLFEDFPDGAGEHWRIISTDTGLVDLEGDLPVDLNHSAFSPDGKLVAGVGASGEVVTIDVERGLIKRAPKVGHSDEGLFVQFSPDGSRLVSGAEDGTVSLWDAHTLDLLGTVSISAEDKPVAAIPHFTDGSDIVTIAAYDGRTYRWDTRIEQTLTYACEMAGRNLTHDEWTQAFGSRPYEKTCP
ncbi:BTAD domain-containing putative transcriptional regulator [Kribbella sp. VKM Ac-2568]|uniref:nSTAND1 domain-containing NTPase n=1 Tax=Kribbella sp. VKM Ac-2568 TaxID=2512219 RepID=UPI001044056D|nr:BTAD domain-containing putative transcriptional regulator [Kribbella sp. VKM Ac-2568]